MWIHIVPHCDTPLKALSHGTHSQGISQFYLHTPHSSAIKMNHTCLLFPAEAGPHLPTPEEWKAELAWVAGYILR